MQLLNISAIFCIGALVVGPSPTNNNQSPTSRLPYWKNLAEPHRILDGSDPINVDVGHAAPTVFDINKDGLKDLIVGQFGGGKLRIYINKDSNSHPRFDGYEYLRVNGKDVSVPYG